MKQNPSRLKYKKNHRPSSSNLFLKEKKTFYPMRGVLMLQAGANGRLTFNQIEACRKTVRRMLKKQVVVYLRVFTNVSITKKPVSIRMGCGKGSHNVWITLIKKGQILCELKCGSIEKFNLSYKALKSAASKLPIITKINYLNY